MRLYTFLLFFSFFTPVFGQKMLLLERANRVRSTQFYIGETIRFRLKGAENYWYERTITDILPGTKTLLLDNFAVRLDSIAQMKVSRKKVTRFVGGTIFTFGASLAFATTIGALYRDKRIDYGAYYAVSGATAGLGYLMNTPRKVTLGKKHRLRIVEISFPTSDLPVKPD